MNLFHDAAKRVHAIYFPSCGFPLWVIDPKEWDNHAFTNTKVYYMKYDLLDDVQQMITQREPCNIGMKRLYDEKMLQKEFGWMYGAYERSTSNALMPNIAVYCYATVLRPLKTIRVHVINLVGYAFDTPDQPDYTYFYGKQNDKTKLIQKYHDMWKKALAAAKDLRVDNKINKLRIFNVGGGAFAGPFYGTFIESIFEPAFLPLLHEFKHIGVEVVGYDSINHRFENVFIPNLLDDPGEDVDHTLYVNAWDPWSLIGNGNERDRSLDGYWGRCSNMAVLGWTVTNPYIQFIAV